MLDQLVHFDDLKDLQPTRKKAKVGSGEPDVRQDKTSGSADGRGPLITYHTFRITGSKSFGDDDFFEFMDCTTQITEFGYQREAGKKNGIEHYQGTFKAEPRKRVTQVQAWFKDKFPAVEFPKKDYCEKSISDAANRYGMKEDTRVAGPWFKGEIFKEIAKETVYKINIELRPWQRKICEILTAEVDERIIWWFWEPKGGLGKTTFQKQIYQNYKGVIPLSGKSADMKNGVIDFKENNNNMVPHIILVNLPRTFKHDYLSYEGIESVKDMWFYSGKYKGGTVCDRPPHLMIFANQPPNLEDDNLTPTKWNIIRLPDGKGERLVPHTETWSE